MDVIDEWRADAADWTVSGGPGPAWRFQSDVDPFTLKGRAGGDGPRVVSGGQARRGCLRSTRASLTTNGWLADCLFP
jgi:hypothetical protein